MVFCSFCGKELPVEAGFCPSCGKPTTSATAGSVTSQSQATQTSRPNLASEGDRIVAVILDTILIFVISLAIFLPLSPLHRILRRLRIISIVLLRTCDSDYMAFLATLFHIL